MSKLNPQARSALQSARAKNRKAVVILGNAASEHDVTVPAHVVKKMQAIEAWFETQLAPKAKAADDSEAETTEATAKAA